jgi:soluble lytic murein transglycosylase-like protein
MAVSDYSSLIQAAANQYALSPSLLASVIQAESSGNPMAVSPAGAQGLMQLMPATAASLGVTNPFDPAQNIDAGARYLSTLINQYGDVGTALAAYNSGPRNVGSGAAWPASVTSYVNGILAQSGTAAPAPGGSTVPIVDLSGDAASMSTADILDQVARSMTRPGWI